MDDFCRGDNESGCAVGRAVIDDNYLKGWMCLLHEGVKAVGDIFFAIKDGDNN